MKQKNKRNFLFEKVTVFSTMDHSSNDGGGEDDEHDEQSGALFPDAIEMNSNGEKYDDDERGGDRNNHLKTVSSSSSSYDYDDISANDTLPYPIRVDFPDVFVSSSKVSSLSSSSSSSSSLTPLHTHQYQPQNEKSNQDIIAPFCDRRLSRAARSLLMEKLQNGRSSGYSSKSGRDEKDKEDENGHKIVWSLLERWMGERLDTRTSGSIPSARDDSCPLHQPERRDVYYDEESTISIVSPDEAFPGGKKYAMKAAFPIISTSASSPSQSPLLSKGSWYKCGICGKVFSTRFYLDFHWETSEHCRRLRHSLKSAKNNRQEGDPHGQLTSSSLSFNPICPATDWCPLVGGMSACHERALRDEPFYDRGVSTSSSTYSGRTVDDEGLMLVRHKWSKIFHSIPCSVETIRHDCRSILKSCGLLDDTSEKMFGEGTFCGKLSCPTQQGAWQYLQDETESFYHWYKSGFKSKESHDYHHEELWKNQESHHANLLSSVGVAVLLGFVGWVYSRTKHEYVISLPMRNNRPGQTTPNSRSSSTSTSGKRLSVSHRRGTARTQKSGTTIRRTTCTQSKSLRHNLTSRRPTSHFHED